MPFVWHDDDDDDDDDESFIQTRLKSHDKVMVYR